MKTTIKVTTAAFVCVLGCQGDTTTSDNGKIEIDAAEQEMSLDPDGDGVAEGAVDGSTAQMTFQLEDPLPELTELEIGEDARFRTFDATEDAALADVVAALSITVSSPRSGASVTLAGSGALVAAPPTGPGEYSVTLSDDRMDFTVEWYNGTASGLSISEGATYDVVYSVGTNCCVAAVSDQALQFQLGG